MVTKVSDEDYEWLSQWKWHAHKGGREKAAWYAARCVMEKGKRRTILMHREITCAKKGEVPDHHNLDSLDNQRENLRIATNSQNQCNTRPYGAIPYKGVFMFKGRYRAAIMVNRKRKYLGYFDTAEEAAMAYNNAARVLHGEFAYLNVLPTVMYRVRYRVSLILAVKTGKIWGLWKA